MDDPQLRLRPDLPGGAGDPGLFPVAGIGGRDGGLGLRRRRLPLADLVLQIDELRRHKARTARA